MLYRVAGLPADHLAVDALLVEDINGHPYLLQSGAPQLTPLEPEEATFVAGLFEPSVDVLWRSVDEMCRTFIYDDLAGAGDAGR